MYWDSGNSMRRTDTVTQGALQGVRVVDLSRVLAGPLCAQMLADHGADVVKVESPAGDETRALGPPFDELGQAAYFTSVNRGKRGMVLDLSNTAGQEALLALLADADVLIENFVPGTMARWGLDYETVLKHKLPRLVYCTISGFGTGGPMGGCPGYDAILQAMCGLMSINGEPAGGPTRIGIPVVDHLAAYTAQAGILMALVERARSGFGQRVEATLFDAAMSLLVPHAANWMYSGDEPTLLGSAHPNIAPYDRFECVDGQIFLGILNDRQFSRFCEHVGLDAAGADERFASNALRLKHRDVLRQQIEAALADRPRQALCDALMQVGVPAGPVNTVSQAFQQPHALHRGTSVGQGDYRGIRNPTRLSRTPGPGAGAPPGHGQHTEQILLGAGYSVGRIAQLKRDAVRPHDTRAPDGP